MSKFLFSTYGHSPALLHARNALLSWGYDVSPNPWEATHLVLPVPSFDENGMVKGGGCLSALLPQLRGDVTIFGGNLDFLQGKKVDFLRDEHYLLENAAITAQCALKYAQFPPGAAVLIIGWGRIGKCLAALLWAMEADVTVAARKEDDRAMAHALGYHAEIPEELGHNLNKFRLICNTAPAAVLSEEQVSHCRENCLKIDLASVRGIADSHVIWARGLPGRDTPESSGKLIAKTVIRHLDRKENGQ